MQIHQLEYFETVARRKSMNKAAEELMISQPSLSKSIRNLEKELGIQAFCRSNKGVELTVEGKKLYEYIRVVMKQLELIRGLKEEKEKNVLLISSFYSFSNGFLLGEFYKKTGNQSEVSLLERRVSQILDDVEHLKSEIGIVQIKKMQMTALKKELQKRSLDATLIAEDEICINVGENHPLYGRSCVSMEELLPYLVIREQDDYFSNLYYFNVVDGIRFTEFKRTMFANNNTSILQMLSTTEAIRFGVRSEEEPLKTYGIATISIANCEDRVSFYWVKRKKEMLSDNAMEFISIVQDYYAKKL